MLLPNIIKDAVQGPQTQGSVASEPKQDLFENIKKLKELLDMGAITQEEFDRKKAEWLAKT